jgi:hypothetical protein
MPDLDELKQLERTTDAAVAQLSVLQLPIRSTLTAIFYVLDALYRGDRLNGQVAPRPDVAMAASARLSYLVRDLLYRCPALPLGSDAADAFSPFRSLEALAEICLLLAYGHLCELMPEVHRGYYTVTKIRDGFELHHQSSAFGDIEIRDIVLAELALPTVVPPPDVEEAIYDEFAACSSMSGHQIALMRGYYQHYLGGILEEPIISDAGIAAAASTTYEEFARFRAAWFAICEWCQQMAAAEFRRVPKPVKDDDVRAIDRPLEWIAPCFKRTFLGGVVLALSGLSPLQFDRLMDIYSLDWEAGKPPHSGDGFLPPIVALPGSYLFHPDVLRTMLAGRNIPYAVNRRDPAKFDGFVSAHMEPRLIARSSDLLARLPAVEVVPNFSYASGEFDLLVYREAENTVLHIQAKGAIPPQGARMVDRLEGRFAEGLRQLNQLRVLDQTEQDAVLTLALHRPIKNATICDFLLGWSCFGTINVWQALGQATPLNLPLLWLVTQRMADQPLVRMSDVSRAVLDELCTSTEPQWTHKDLQLGNSLIRIPMLDFRSAELMPAKIRYFGACRPGLA